MAILHLYYAIIVIIILFIIVAVLNMPYENNDSGIKIIHNFFVTLIRLLFKMLIVLSILIPLLMLIMVL